MTQIVTKTWYLLDEVTRDDLDTLHRAGVEIYIHDDHPIVTPDSRFKSVPTANLNIQIITCNDEQEAWLKLCFGDRLEHFSIRYNIQ